MGKLKTQHLVNAAMRLADQELIGFYVTKKGDPDSGIIFIECDVNGRQSMLYARAMSFEGVYEYTAISGEAPRDRHDIAALIEREVARDQDCWVISVEGQKGLQIFEQIT